MGYTLMKLYLDGIHLDGVHLDGVHLGGMLLDVHMRKPQG